MFVRVSPKIKKTKILHTFLQDQKNIICFCKEAKESQIQMISASVNSSVSSDSKVLKAISYDGILRRNFIQYRTEFFERYQNKLILTIGETAKDIAKNRILLPIRISINNSEEIIYTVYNPNTIPIEITTENRIKLGTLPQISQSNQVILPIIKNIFCTNERLIGFLLAEEFTRDFMILNFLEINFAEVSDNTILCFLDLSIKTEYCKNYLLSSIEHLYQHDLMYSLVSLLVNQGINFSYFFDHYNIRNTDSFNSLALFVGRKIFSELQFLLENLDKANRQGNPFVLTLDQMSLELIGSLSFSCFTGIHNSRELFKLKFNSGNKIFNSIIRLEAFGAGYNWSLPFFWMTTPEYDKNFIHQIKFLSNIYVEFLLKNRVYYDLAEFTHNIGKIIFAQDKLNRNDYKKILFTAFSAMQVNDDHGSILFNVNSPFNDPGQGEDPPNNNNDPEGGIVIDQWSNLPLINNSESNGYYSAKEEEWIKNCNTPIGITKIFDTEGDN